MSIDVRHVTNGAKSGYYVRNSGVTPMTVDFYSRKEEIPESIRHYAPDGEPKYWGPDMARIMGCQNLLYPDWPKRVDIQIMMERRALLKAVSMRRMMTGKCVRISKNEPR